MRTAENYRFAAGHAQNYDIAEATKQAAENEKKAGEKQMH
jgi:hypothetical protein